MQAAVIKLSRAADQTLLTFGQGRGQIVFPPVKIDQGDLAGGVRTIDPIGNATIGGRRRVMLVDRQFEGHDPTGLEIGQIRAVAAVDGPDGQVPQQIDHLFAEQSFHILANPRSDPFEGRYGGENRKQDFWSGTRRHGGNDFLVGTADSSGSYRYILRQRQRPSL